MISQQQKDLILLASEDDWEKVRSNLPSGYLKQTANFHRRNAGLKPFTLNREYNKFDEFFFESPNLENSYWAGFIAADGCIIEGKGRGQDKVVVSLADRDRPHLEALAEDLGEVRVYIRDRGHLQNATMSISSDKMVQDLELNFNITPRKSLTLVPPTDLSDEESIAFIAGYIDGDGCYKYSHANGRRYPQIVILGTEEVLTWIRSVLCPDTKVNIKGIGGTSVKSLSISGRKAVKANDILSRVSGIPRLKRKTEYWLNNSVFLDYT